MSEACPEPLVPPECSMAGNDWFPFHFDRLRKSKWWRRASDTARSRNVMMWGEAFKSVPAGSLPDDDDELAEAAGYGMDVDAFLSHKAEIMAPWVLCSDGRWYHPTVCEVVLDTWERTSDRRKAAAERQRRRRDKVRSVTPKTQPVTPSEPPVTRDNAENGRDFGIQDRTGQTVQLEANASVASASPRATDGALALALEAPEPIPPPDPWDGDPDFGKLWAMAPPMMRKRAKSRAKVWPVWKRALRVADAARILGGFARYKAMDTDLPRSGGPGLHIWLSDRTWEEWTGVSDRISAWGDAEWSAVLRIWRTSGEWGDEVGPPPGSPGCRVPAHLLVSPVPGAAA